MEAISQIIDRIQPPTIGPPAIKVEVCPRCRGAEYVTRDLPIVHPDFSRLYPCQCVQDRLKTRRLARVNVDSGLPPHQVGMTFENFVPGQSVSLMPPYHNDRSAAAGRVQARRRKLGELRISLRKHLERARARALEFARQPQGFLTFLGEAGCGKTHLASAIANYRLARGQVTQFSVVPDLLDHLRATFSPDSGISYDARFEAYKQTPLLVLDDLGTENTTPWASEKLYQLINYRYNFGLPMVITSNELPSHLDLRLQSRLFDRHRNSAFEILAGDYRMRKPG